ncbi:pro-resilin-like [Musca domestica]|uniref:Pro-resilin-like n=2 Tax=Musca domestica TaxID=7370 RepID=A0A9J7I9E1_MUSDO|nr:pro-resilin-like [Musca domestica]
MRMKAVAVFYYFTLLIVLVAAQNRNRSVRRRAENASQGSEEQGRTLGLLRPLLNVGSLGGFGLGFDQPIAPYRPSYVRPQSSPVRPQSDPFYGGGYGVNPYYGYGGYGYRPSYGGFIPQYAGYPSYGYGYRPAVYPGAGNYGGGYPSYNPQRPGYGGAAGVSPSRPVPAVGGNVGAAGGTPSLAGLDPAQAAQIANLLGQLLGSQLRPLLGAAGRPGDAPSSLVKK